MAGSGKGVEQDRLLADLVQMLGPEVKRSVVDGAGFAGPVVLVLDARHVDRVGVGERRGQVLGLPEIDLMALEKIQDIRSHPEGLG